MAEAATTAVGEALGMVQEFVAGEMEDAVEVFSSRIFSVSMKVPADSTLSGLRVETSLHLTIKSLKSRTSRNTAFLVAGQWALRASKSIQNFLTCPDPVRGQKVILWTNYFKVVPGPYSLLHRYTVAVQPAAARRNLIQIITLLLSL